MKKIFSLLILSLASLAALADDATYQIIYECDTTINLTVSDINLGSRDIHLIHYEYPSKDIEGKPVTVSGSVWVPKNIYDGTAPNDGVIQYLTTDPAAAARALDASTYDETAPAFYLLRQYEQTLATWLLGAGIDVQYDKWGW